MTYVVDTHPLVWYLTGNSRLSTTARDAFDDPNSQIAIPAIVLAEIRFLHSRGRITVGLPAVLAYIRATANCRIQPLDEDVIVHLPGTLDIHDALIVATAIMYRDDRGETVALITRDAAIKASGLVSVVW